MANVEVIEDVAPIDVTAEVLAHSPWSKGQEWISTLDVANGTRTTCRKDAWQRRDSHEGKITIKQLKEILVLCPDDAIVLLQDWNEDYADPAGMESVTNFGETVVLGMKQQ